MTTLTGSEKQVNWATTIREDAMAGHQRELARLTAWLASEYSVGEEQEPGYVAASTRIAELRQDLSVMETISEATFWIDNRLNLSRALRMVGASDSRGI